MSEPETEISGSGFWTPKSLGADASGRWRIGPLSLWARRRNHEWWVYAERGATDDRAPEFTEGKPPKDDAPWKRWAFKEGNEVVRLIPATPDRPVVVRPETALSIPPGNEILFFVSVPLWVRVFVGDISRVFLTEEPARVLSNTWFGDPAEGELCYALKTGASRSLDGAKRGHYRFICPLLIKNPSPEALHFKKISLPVPYLRLYQGVTRVWSNGISVAYRGHNLFSAVSFDDDPPAHETGMTPVGDPRLTAHKSFIRRTFETFRAHTF